MNINVKHHFFKLVLLLLTASCTLSLVNRGAAETQPEAVQKGDPPGIYAQLRSAKIYYEIHGMGEPVVLLHPGLASSSAFVQQLPTFSKEYRVILIDRRGHGYSPDTEESFSYEAMADDTLELLDQLGLDNVRLFGWGDGGIVALAIAMKQPERVTALALYAADFHYKSSVADGFYDQYEHMSPVDESLTTARTVYQAKSPHPDQWPVFLKKSFAMWSTQPTYTVEQLGTIQAPTLVMTGDQDIVLPEHTKAMAQAIPHATMVVLPNSTHWAPSSNPEPVNAAVLSFFLNQNPELAKL